MLRLNSGFISLFVGGAMILSYVLFTQNSAISDWLIWSFLSLSSLFPLVGLGVGFSLVDVRLAIVGLAVFVGSFFISLYLYGDIWFYFLANESQHLYLTLPLSSLFVGILLILPNSMRKWLILLTSAVVGAMMGIGIKLTDPTLHDPIILKIGLLVGFWVVVTSMLIVKRVYKKWFYIPIRIFGSWLLASGLLYGGTSLGVKYGKITPTKTKQIKEQIPDVDIVPDFGF